MEKTRLAKVALVIAVAVMLLSACARGKNQTLPIQTSPEATKTVSKPAKTITPTVVVSTPLPSITPSPTPTPTITQSPTPSPSPTPTYETFVGKCDTATQNGLCFKNWGWGIYAGKRVLRYVFLHAKYPKGLKVRINGTQLACEAAPAYGEGGVVCYGLPLGTISGNTRLDFAYFLPDGKIINGVVPAEIKSKLRLWFKVYYPPTATPTPAG